MSPRRPRIEIDLARRELRRDGAVVPVQRKVFELLSFFVEHPDRAIPRAELLGAVWGDVVVTEASLNQAIRAARKAIADDPAEPQRLITLRGFGYRWVSSESVASPSPSEGDDTLEHEEPTSVWSGCPHLVVAAAANGAAVDRGIVPLDGVDRVDVGRAPSPTRSRAGARVVVGIPSPTLSRQHAWILRREDGVFVIEDGGSKNGTQLAGRSVERAPLEDGDWIACGPLLLRFRHAPVRVDDARAPALRTATCDPRLGSELLLASRVLAEGGPVVLSLPQGTDGSRLAGALHALAGRPGASERLQLERGRASAMLASSMASHEGGSLVLGGLDAWTQEELSVVAQALDGEADVSVIVAAGAERAPFLAGCLGAHVVRVPPLCERTEDLGLLFDLALPGGETLAWSAEALARLTRYAWPGDERELVAMVRSLLARESRVVSEDALPMPLRDGRGAP